MNQLLVIPRMRRGFSLVEVLLAFTLLALAIIPLLNMMRTASHQSQQTAEFGQALIVAERAAEKLRLENWENVHQIDEITSNPSWGDENKLVDGNSPFFSVVEDSKPPYGLIRNGEDLAVTHEYGALYDTLLPFSLGYESNERSLETTGAVMDLTLRISWMDHLRHHQQLTLPVVLQRHSVPDDTPHILKDRTLADEQIVKQLYPNFAGQALPSIVARTGANLATIRTIGEGAIFGLSFVRHAANMHQEEQQLLTELAAGPTSADSARIHMKLGQMYERMAKARLGAICSLAEPLHQLGENFEHAQLGTPPPEDARFLDSLFDLAGMGPAFEWELYGAINAYLDCCEPPLAANLSPRVRTRILMKVVDLTKLMVLTSTPQNLPFLRQLLGNMLLQQDGHNPNFTDFAQRELEIAGTLESLQNDYPIPDRWYFFGLYTDWISPALEKVSQDPEAKEEIGARSR